VLGAIGVLPAPSALVVSFSADTDIYAALNRDGRAHFGAPVRVTLASLDLAAHSAVDLGSASERSV
jgi:hypothetical protein